MTEYGLALVSPTGSVILDLILVLGIVAVSTLTWKNFAEASRKSREKTKVVATNIAPVVAETEITPFESGFVVTMGDMRLYTFSKNFYAVTAKKVQESAVLKMGDKFMEALAQSEWTAVGVSKEFESARRSYGERVVGSDWYDLSNVATAEKQRLH